MRQALIDQKIQLAYRHMQSGQKDLAEKLLRQALKQDPDHSSEASAALAELYTTQQKHQAAIDVLDAARSKQSVSAANLTRYADVYKNWGRFEDAKACYRQAIALDPKQAPRLYLALATTSRICEYDDDVRMMEALHASAANNPAARRFLAFALGKAFDDLKDYDRAFGYFFEANEIVAATRPAPAMDTLGTLYEEIARITGPEFVSRHEASGISDPMPLFVTGLPRSGTTLVEQVLASHPTVHGGGEKRLLTEGLLRASRSQGLRFPVGFDTVDAEIFRKVARNFVNDIDHGKPHTTNKSLSNYLWVGWIRAFLPNAKIVICNRDPKDMGLSSYQLDLGRAYDWSYRLKWIGQQYRAFSDLTAHWVQLFPDQIHIIQYEEMTADPEPHIRALLDYCNLEFDPACLESHKTKRVVTTSSRAQVREPIYRSSVGRWKHYEKHLGPLLDALGTEHDHQ